MKTKNIKMFAYGLFALCFLLTGSGAIGETYEIQNSLQTKGISGEIVDGSIDWGQVSVDDSVNTNTIGDTQTINNTSVGYAVDARIQVVDFTGSGENTLIASWDGTPALDEFEMSIPAKSITLTSDSWGDIIYTIPESGSEAVDFQLLMGSEISVVDTYTGTIRIALTEAI